MALEGNFANSFLPLRVEPIECSWGYLGGMLLSDIECFVQFCIRVSQEKCILVWMFDNNYELNGVLYFSNFTLSGSQLVSIDFCLTLRTSRYGQIVHIWYRITNPKRELNSKENPILIKIHVSIGWQLKGKSLSSSSVCLLNK